MTFITCSLGSSTVQFNMVARQTNCQNIAQHIAWKTGSKATRKIKQINWYLLHNPITGIKICHAQHFTLYPTDLQRIQKPAEVQKQAFLCLIKNQRNYFMTHFRKLWKSLFLSIDGRRNLQIIFHVIYSSLPNCRSISHSRSHEHNAETFLTSLGNRVKQ